MRRLFSAAAALFRIIFLAIFIYGFTFRFEP
jgi:hypothetical protein